MYSENRCRNTSQGRQQRRITGCRIPRAGVQEKAQGQGGQRVRVTNLRLLISPGAGAADRRRLDVPSCRRKSSYTEHGKPSIRRPAASGIISAEGTIASGMGFAISLPVSVLSAPRICCSDCPSFASLRSPVFLYHV